MNSLFDKYGLTPQERRLVVGVGIAVFVVLNLWLIIPKFGEFGRLQQKMSDIQRLQLDKYKAEIANKPTYEAKIRDLLKTGGSDVPTEEAALRIFDEVNAQAALTGVNLTSITPVNRSGGKTNAFFEEASVNVQYNCGEKELVDFLYRIADRSLLIRAKSMGVGPDPTRTRLQGKVTLVKSYQRKPPPKPAGSPAAPAAKPAPATTTKGPPAPTPTAKPSAGAPTNPPARKS
ncbi:MAG: hypothetical protein RJA22_1397 [Verrucomicrobiota bacterium]|jgi:hypothetical protein